MIGVEIVEDQKTKEPAPKLRDAIENLAFAKGLLILGAGENTLRFAPPLVIDQEQADFAVDTLEACSERLNLTVVSPTSKGRLLS